MPNVTAHDIAKMIDHSLLNPKFTRQEVEAGCLLAKKYDCATVCVKPCDVELAYSILKDTDVITTTVIGFPHGSNVTAAKVLETEIAIQQGCKEIDVVLNIGRLLSGDYELVEKDLQAVTEAAHAKNVIVKVIMENAYLNDEQKKKACEICAKVGADYTKTSTGYAPSGASIADLKLMRANTPDRMKVKAAGGVRTLDDALAVRAVGTSRFGCTTTAVMLDEAKAREAAGTLTLPDPAAMEELAYLKK